MEFARWHWLPRGRVISGFILSVCGCAQLAPPDAGPIAPTPLVESTEKTETNTKSNQVLPISLDTVLHLAEEQNAQIGQARERLREAYADKDLAGKKWLPDIYVGLAYYRHEGGIQNEDGTLLHSSHGAMFAGMEIDSRLDIRDVAYEKVNAQRKVWQQKGELSRSKSETLLEAANTYIDWLSARAGEVIAHEMAEKMRQLAEKARKTADLEPAAKVEVFRVQAELDGQQQTIEKLRSQAAGAAAKLVYLLALDPATALVPVEKKLVPFEIVDASPATNDLVQKALAEGPGVKELDGLLTLVQESIDKSKGFAQFLPIFEVRMAEGGFGAGPGDRMDWDNRWDLGLQARWNLTHCLTQHERQRAIMAKVQQAHLAAQDLRGKLTAGVQEARETIISSKGQLDLCLTQIRNSEETYKLSFSRLENLPQTASFTETLLAIGSIGRAKGNYLGVINSLDKAQLRLLVLLGGPGPNGVK